MKTVLLLNRVQKGVGSVFVCTIYIRFEVELMSLTRRRSAANPPNVL